MTEKPFVPTARQLMSHAAKHAARAFKRFGNVAPIWHGVTRSGESVVVGGEMPDGGEARDVVAHEVREKFKEMDVVACVFLVECWLLISTEPGDQEWAKEHGVRNHPDRREAVWYVAEDEIGFVSGYQLIDRPPGMKPRLLALVEQTEKRGMEMQGRFVGMLPKDHKVHH